MPDADGFIDITDPSETARMTALDPIAYPEGWADEALAYGLVAFRPVDPAFAAYVHELAESEERRWARAGR